MKKSKQVDKINNINNIYSMVQATKHENNKVEFKLSDNFLDNVVYLFDEYCKTQNSYFSGYIFEYPFIEKFISEYENEIIIIDYTKNTILIKNELIQFPSFKMYSEIKELIMNYLITILYFEYVWN
jgi:hypothetical protein